MALDLCQCFISAQYGQNLTIFCLHINIDKIYFGIVKLHFFAYLQQSFGPLLMSEFRFAQYLVKEWTEFKQILYTHYDSD